jgi:hypothetical protein
MLNSALLNPYNNPVFAPFFPLQEAKGVSLNPIVNDIFTKTGAIKSNANKKAKSFCSLYKIEYSDFYDMIEKNYNFYHGEFRDNNPDLTNEDIFKKQTLAFKRSTYNRIATQYSKQYLEGATSFIWLPSDNVDTRDSHEIRYGVTYTIENPPETLPAEEPNCGCGAQILY